MAALSVQLLFSQPRVSSSSHASPLSVSSSSLPIPSANSWRWQNSMISTTREERFATVARASFTGYGESIGEVLSDVQIFSAAGEPVMFKDLWDQKEGMAVVALLRHFGCPCCWELAAALKEVKPKFDSSGVKLIAVGVGAADKARILAERLPFPSDCLYADPDRKAYDVLGLYYGFGRTFFNPASAKVLSRFDSLQKAVKNYTISATPDDRSGVLQQGGMFVFKGKTLLYARKDEGTVSLASAKNLPKSSSFSFSCLKMARGTRSRRRISARQLRPTPYPLPSYSAKCLDMEVDEMKSKLVDKKDWEDAVCSVCMEYPHNAVLLLCSSHDKGCRPYMCGTSYRYSNCLDQFKKAYTKVMSPPHGQGQVQDSLFHESADSPAFAGVGWPSEKYEVTELACPLCRGQVKGWTVVESAREYLNAKKRSCMQDECSFVGTYKELRKHVRAVHPSARPRKVDPILEQKWRRLEREREREDVISTIRSSMPGAMVLGDYVIEGGPHHGFDSDDDDDDDGEIDEDGDFDVSIDDSNWLNVLLLLQAFGPSGGASLSSRLRRLERGYRALEGDGSRAPAPIVSNGTAVSASASDLEDRSTSSRGRTIGLGRPERRRRRRSRRRTVIDMS
ncbi:hypothetical protein H6P81_011078 [Aristolochia fimbriata]|uniref:Uncharacterized protein n=1 Tax=Aristolochia fimbriata TaxID=158543 RepID=A0AAV7EV03_ARIFI|nr:hypothetical protein H6P81_011078 [Aristolochia fimbriata]